MLNQPEPNAPRPIPTIEGLAPQQHQTIVRVDDALGEIDQRLVSVEPLISTAEGVAFAEWRYDHASIVADVASDATARIMVKNRQEKRVEFIDWPDQQEALHDKVCWVMDWPTHAK